MVFHGMLKETGSDVVPIDDGIDSGLVGYPVPMPRITAPGYSNVETSH